MLKMTSQQVLQICKGDTEIAAHFNTLLAVIAKQSEQIERLEKRVHELERQLGQNSNNSSKPPSSDGFRKPTNLRKPGGKRGAPLGHEGHTRHFSQQPDEIILHAVSTCTNCAASLEAVAAKSYTKRQVLDLPIPRLIVTEHRAEEKCCPVCRTRQRASFPVHVNAPVQYGDGFSAWTAYLNVYQLLPLQRIGQLFADLTGYRPSEATLLSQIKSTAHALKSSVIPAIREKLLGQAVLHTDETGVRLDGKQHWLHTVSNADWTLLAVHPTRGGPKVEDMGILSVYRGIMVHDCLSSYFKPQYTFKHVLCNAHLLRECQGIAEYDHHQWAVEMKELLQKSWVLVKATRAAGVPLSDEVITEIGMHYDDILERGKAEWAKDAIPAKTGPRGRKCKSKAANLGQRFELHKEAILRFLYDARVPFDNNQAERDIRMSKVKQKISGAFRTIEGGEQFAVIRAFISTLIKQKLPLHSSMISALRGQFSFQGT